jgi:orotate phosphoribosyltransferase
MKPTSDTVDYGKEIAEAALEIGAIELRPNKPFKWSYGGYNPIYNDNRMLLGSYKHRMLVRDAILQIIKENSFAPKFICGTSLSGIAPAKSVLEGLQATGPDLHPRLAILADGKLFVDTQYGSQPSNYFHSVSVDAICSTAPWAIVFGVEIANEAKLPFMYVRPERKQHGKGKILEGRTDLAKNIALVEYADAEHALEVLCEEKITVLGSNYTLDDRRWVLANHPQLASLSFKDKDVIVIEDLVSTGGSALKEVKACREAGANVLGVISIFNYGLQSAQQAFADANCPLYSVLTYNKLLEVAKEKNMFDAPQLEILADWRNDQPNWGDKHGFPAEKK